MTFTLTQLFHFQNCNFSLEGSGTVKMSSDNQESPTSNSGTHNSSQIFSTSTVTSSAASHLCGNNKLNNEQQIQSKNRICRDFVRGNCRRLYCKVAKLTFRFEFTKFYFISSIHMCSQVI